MKKITLFITVLACLLSLSCTRQKTSGNDTFCHSGVESTTDSVASCAGAVANIPQKMIGTYTDINDGSTLEIGNSTNSGLSVKITVPFCTTVISTSPKSHAISSFLANVISCVALLPLWLTVTVCVPSGTTRSISSVILRITLSPTSIQPFTK